MCKLQGHHMDLILKSGLVSNHGNHLYLPFLYHNYYFQMCSIEYGRLKAKK